MYAGDGGITLFAPAKVNIVLEVGPGRKDGFHEVKGVMAPIPLYDILVVRPAQAINVRMHGFDLPIQENLAYQAARSFFGTTGIRGGADIEVFKAIPAGMGLGGGSSDAVAVLRGLDFLYGGITPHETMMSMAAGLGSDCPFFLDPQVSLFEGRGTDVHAVPGARLPLILIVIPVPGNGMGLGPLSTRVVYGRFDDLNHESAAMGTNAFGVITKSAIRTLTKTTKGVNMTRPCVRCFNALEPAILDIMPKAAALKQAVLEAGAYDACFSGAGVAVVGFFESGRRMLAAIARLGPLLGPGYVTLWFT